MGDEAPELAEVLAAHFLDAANAEPDAADAPRIRAAACETLADAGERALSLALGPEAQRAFERAASLAEDDRTRAGLLDRAGRAAQLNADYTVAYERFEQAIELRDDEAAPLLAQATEIFTRLRATPYLQRAQALEAGVTA